MEAHNHLGILGRKGCGVPVRGFGIVCPEHYHDVVGFATKRSLVKPMRPVWEVTAVDYGSGVDAKIGDHVLVAKEALEARWIGHAVAPDPFCHRVTDAHHPLGPGWRGRGRGWSRGGGRGGGAG